jgi:hypothetical protein
MCASGIHGWCLCRRSRWLSGGCAVTPTSHKCDSCVAFQSLTANFRTLQADWMLRAALYMCMIAMAYRLHDACANTRSRHRRRQSHLRDSKTASSDQEAHCPTYATRCTKAQWSQRTQSTQRSRGSSGRGPRAGLDRSLATLWSIVIEVFVPHFRSERNRLQRAGLQVRSLGRRRIV